jgi:hypothetical protein
MVVHECAQQCTKVNYHAPLCTSVQNNATVLNIAACPSHNILWRQEASWCCHKTKIQTATLMHTRAYSCTIVHLWISTERNHSQVASCTGSDACIIVQCHALSCNLVQFCAQWCMIMHKSAHRYTVVHQRPYPRCKLVFLSSADYHTHRFIFVSLCAAWEYED